MNRPDQGKPSRKKLTKALNISYRYLGHRARSIKEIQDHLGRKGYDSTIIDSVITTLTKENLLDDKAFAGAFVENRQRFKPRSRFALGYELKQKGISDAVIDETIRDIDDYGSAWNAVTLKAGLWKRLDRKAYQKKVMNLLKNRGFNYEVARSVFFKCWNNKEAGGTSHENSVF